MAEKTELTLEEAANKNASTKEDAGKVKYKCNTKCYFENVLYNEGDIVLVSKDKKMPEHFSKVLF